MDDGIIFVCNSINNKNVRKGELVILEKHEDDLYFEFGESKINLKKRFYNDKESLNKDFDKLLKIKEESSIIKEEDIDKSNIKETENNQENKEDYLKEEKNKKTNYKKNTLF